MSFSCSGRRVCLTAAAALVAAGLSAPFSTSPASASVSTGVGSAVSSPSRPAGGPEVTAADGEVLRLRTATSRTYFDPRGFHARLYSEPVNVRDAQGRWQPIDNTLTAAPDGKSLRNTRGLVDVSLPAAGDGTTKVAVGNAWTAFALQGASGAGRRTAGRDSVSYTEVLPGVDARYQVRNAGLKEDLVLKNASAAASFRFALTASPGLSFTAAQGGSVALRAGDGSTLFSLPAPSVQDSSGKPGGFSSSAARYTLTGSGSAAVLSVTVDPAWLADPSRVFPVSLDPSSTAPAQTQATYLYAGAPTTNYATDTRLRIGLTGASAYRTLLKYDTASLPQHIDVLSSRVKADITANSAGLPASIGVFALTRPWTNAATWNTTNGSTAWTSPGGDVGAALSSPADSITTTNTSIEAYVTKAVQDWYATPSSNNGVMLRMNPETTATVLDVNKLATTPWLDVNYVPHVGDRPFYSYYDQPLTDRSGLRVNLANGNLILSNQDLKIENPGGPKFAVSRQWESVADHRNPSGNGFPAQWKQLIGRDIRLDEYSDGKLFTGPEGYRAWFAKAQTGTGNTTYTTPQGINADLTYKGNGVLELRFRQSGQTYEFGDYGFLTKIKDRNGNAITFAYATPLDLYSRNTTITDSTGRAVTMNYDGLGRLGSMTDSTSRSWGYTYDSTGDYLTSYTDPNGKTTTYSYDAAGLISQVLSPRGLKTNFTYDTNARVTSIQRVTSSSGTDTGPTTTFAYTDTSVSYTDSKGTVFTYPGKTVLTDANNHATTHYFDSNDRITRTVDTLGDARSKSYTANSDVATATDAMGTGQSAGNTSSNSYDTDNRATGSSAPTGAASSLGYAEAAGTVTSQVAHWQPSSSGDPDGNKAGFTYDGPGNITETRDTTNGPTGGASVKYGVYGNTGVAACGGRTGQTGQVCTVTDGNGRVTTNHYNSSGELDLISPPTTSPASLGTTAFSYDGLSRVATKTDGKGQLTRYSYDALDRVTRQQFNGASTCTATDISNGLCLSSGYDDDGNPTSTLDQTGTTTVGYDRLNRETSRSLPSTGTTSLTYDPVGNVVTATDAAGTLTYTYDNANKLSTLLEPGGSCTASPKDRCTSFGYDNNGRRKDTTYPTGSTPTVMTSTFDNSGRVSNIKAQRGATTFSDLSYTYSRMVGSTATDGALTRTRTNNQATGSTGKTTSYLYDTLARLTSAVEKDTVGTTTTASWTYSYDNAGNRTNATLSPTGTGGTTAFTYNANNEILSRAGSSTGWAYDANGNETAAVGATTRTAGTWNPKQQLTSTTAGGSAYPMAYTGTGNQTRLSAGPASYRNTALGVTAQTASGTTTNFIRDAGGTLVAMRSGSSSYYYLYDALGSVVALISPTGTKTNSYNYDPYGQSRTKTEPSPTPGNTPAATSTAPPACTNSAFATTTLALDASPRRTHRDRTPITATRATRPRR